MILGGTIGGGYRKSRMRKNVRRGATMRGHPGKGAPPPLRLSHPFAGTKRVEYRSRRTGIVREMCSRYASRVRVRWRYAAPRLSLFGRDIAGHAVSFFPAAHHAAKHVYMPPRRPQVRPPQDGAPE